MERTEIANRVKAMISQEDLLQLINELKAEDLGDNAYPFSMRQLRYFCNPNNESRRYIHFDIKKKSGKEPRHITAPQKTLKMILTYLNQILQAVYEPLPCVMGFVSNRSVADNASKHIGKLYVYNIDLKDFFPSIDQARIWKKMQCPPFNFCNQEDPNAPQRRVLADMIAGFCCMKKPMEDGEIKQRYVLPQGSPCSPVLTNIICERMDRRLTGLANRFGATYTRYADDMTFSSMHNIYQDDSEFIKELHRIISDQNFRINPAKTRLCTTKMRQEVTGLTVNEKANVSRKYLKELRRNLHNWEYYGYNEAYKRFYARYKMEVGHKKHGEPVMENVLGGKLLYLKMVKGESDPTYQKLQKRFDILVEAKEGRMSQYADSKFRYIVTYRIAEFEDIISTKIQIGVSDNGNKYAFYENGSKRTYISLSKNIGKEGIHTLFISLCENQKGKRFYLIHRAIEEKAKVETKQTLHLDAMLDKLLETNFDIDSI